MEDCCGIDVSLERSSVYVVDAESSIVREAAEVSDPDALIAWLSALALPLSRIGLEAGPLSQWLYGGLAKAGFAVELLETRHVRAAFETMPVKTDKKDAQGIAQLMRLGWFWPVHCKSLPAQKDRAVLTARKLVQTGAPIRRQGCERSDLQDRRSRRAYGAVRGSAHHSDQVGQGRRPEELGPRFDWGAWLLAPARARPRSRSPASSPRHRRTNWRCRLHRMLVDGTSFAADKAAMAKG